MITNTDYDPAETDLFNLTQDIRPILTSMPQETRVAEEGISSIRSYEEENEISHERHSTEQNGHIVVEQLSLNGGQKTNYPPKERRSFLSRRKNPRLGDYIAQALLEAEEARETGEELKGLSPTEVMERVKILGFVTSAKSYRSFYNTVFQALNRYPTLIEKLEGGRRYKLVKGAEPREAYAESLQAEDTSKEIQIERSLLNPATAQLEDYVAEYFARKRPKLNGPIEIAEWLEISGYSRNLMNKRTLANTLLQVITKGVKRGIFKKEGRGKYQLAEGVTPETIMEIRNKNCPRPLIRSILKEYEKGKVFTPESLFLSLT